MEDSRQIHLNTANYTTVNSTIYVNLGTNSIRVPKNKNAMISLQSAEIANNWATTSTSSSTATSTTSTSIVFTNNSTYDSTLPTFYKSTVVSTTATTNVILLTTTNTSWFRINSRIKFVGQPNGGLSVDTPYYIKSVSSGGGVNITISTTLGGSAVVLTSSSNLTSKLSIVTYDNSNNVVKTINLSSVTDLSGLATALHNYSLDYIIQNPTASGYQTIKTTAVFNSATSVITLSVPSGYYMYFQEPITILGVSHVTFGNSISISVPAPTTTTTPIVRKYVLVKTSLNSCYKQPLAKIQCNQPYGNFIFYSPQVPYQVRIYDEFISIFTVTLLDEQEKEITNSSANHSLTFQIDFVDKLIPQKNNDNDI